MLDSKGNIIDRGPKNFITNIEKSKVELLKIAAERTGIKIEIKGPTKPEINKGYVGLYVKTKDLTKFWDEFDKLIDTD